VWPGERRGQLLGPLGFPGRGTGMLTGVELMGGAGGSGGRNATRSS
jgi:hypothetical protein